MTNKAATTPKALLSFSIITDHEDRNTEVKTFVKLYKEDGQLIWRLDGHVGDECETLPHPQSIAQAKADARQTYLKGGAWKPLASWM